ncbi:acyl carrier protein [Aliarcobacter cryaerophilus]|uniref:acyl carrier protein n=1 Tax=Aliarcobacter cryaerophilus TaxID=28198 RepID=UPI0021B60D3F|nr:acyl carrier protein [Aliarcobacter cryaerophilus]MCT7518852.1 acyl carrier protein [Aliarcobacter cryaerophilus]
MENKIIQIAKEMFNDEINIDSKIGDLQIWDSLGQLNLFMAIESNLNIKFSIDEIIQSDSIRKIVKLIENKTKEI